MLYLITNQEELYDNSEVYGRATIDDVIHYLKSVEETSLDMETEGFDPHTKNPLSLQLGDYENQFVIDMKTVDIRVLKPYLERLLILGQNLKFDLRFLMKFGIYIRKIYDTMVVEKILNCGLLGVRVALDELTDRYLGFKLDKSIRGSIHKEGLSTRVIRYAADDVKYLSSIRTRQIEELIAKDLKGVANLENRFTPCLAYIEYCGFKLSIPKWQEKMRGDNLRLLEAAAKLNAWVLDKGMHKYFKKQLSLFEPITCSINWASSPQVVPLFEELDLNCDVITKGVAKKSVEAKVIEPQAKKSTIVPLYLEYKKAEKVTGTYGANFIRQINSFTKRLHTTFKQIMDTGRLSSGGKDKSQKIEHVNFQNIPKDKETRGCFVAEEGNVLIISDYSGQEQIILANRSLDPNILKFYDEGLSDMHSFVASKMYPTLEGMSVKEIKANHSDLRYNAKTAGFAINYGGVGATIARNNNLTLEEGNAVYDAYFKAFPGLKVYFDRVKQQGLRDGYILISPLTRRKCYIDYFDKYRALEREFDDDFWDRYRWTKQSQNEDFKWMKEKVSKYFMYKGEIERNSLNYPIQGQAAEVTKISCIYIYDYLVDNNLMDTVRFVNTVHDENILECPKEMSQQIADMVEDCMCRAGDLYCKRVKLVAKPEISSIWEK